MLDMNNFARMLTETATKVAKDTTVLSTENGIPNPCTPVDEGPVIIPWW